MPGPHRRFGLVGPILGNAVLRFFPISLSKCKRFFAPFLSALPSLIKPQTQNGRIPVAAMRPLHLFPCSLDPSSLLSYSFADTIRTGPSSPEGSSGESALYGAKSLNVYFFTA